MEKRKRDVFGWARRLWRERRPLVISAILLLIGLPVVILLAQLSGKEAKSPVVTKAINQYRTDTAKGDYDTAYDKLKAQENQPMPKAQKVELYAALAAAAANLNKPTEAIGYL